MSGNTIHDPIVIPDDDLDFDYEYDFLPPAPAHTAPTFDVGILYALVQPDNIARRNSLVGEEANVMNAHDDVHAGLPAPTLYVQPASAAPNRYVLTLSLDWYSLCQVLALVIWLGLA